MNEVTRKKLKKLKIKNNRSIKRGTIDRPRVTVFRSLKHLSVQAINDTEHKTICQISTSQKDIKEKTKGKYRNNETVKLVGKLFGEKLKGLNIKSIIFDRNGFFYHGNIKFLADSIRESGIKF